MSDYSSTWAKITGNTIEVADFTAEFDAIASAFPSKVENGDAVTFTTIGGTVITASTNFVGDLTGNVTGDLTGDVTGNVTGEAGTVANNGVVFNTDVAISVADSSFSATTAGVAVPRGVNNVTVTAGGAQNVYYEIYVNGGWKIFAQASPTNTITRQVVSDASNVRVRTDTGTATVYYRRLF